MCKVVMNKWNKKKYAVMVISGNQVTLEREDGSLFTIAMSEYKFNYIEVE